MSVTVLTIVSVSAVLSVLAIMMAFESLIEVRAMQKSTHSIQYVPASSEFEKVSQDLEQKLDKDLFNNL
jgi:hypothetical protein